MSNSHLFMSSGFPRPPLKNGIGRYVCQLKRVTIKFCKSHGGSRGIRYVHFLLYKSSVVVKVEFIISVYMHFKEKNIETERVFLHFYNTFTKQSA